jgi:hypothetical protein
VANVTIRKGALFGEIHLGISYTGTKFGKRCGSGWVSNFLPLTDGETEVKKTAVADLSLVRKISDFLLLV